MKMIYLIGVILVVTETALKILNEINDLLSGDLIRALLFIIEVMPTC